MRITLISALLLLTGCAARRPVNANWRFIPQRSSDLLIPPGVRPDLAKRSVAIGHPTGHSCPARITVTREMLLNQPQGWLTTWSSDLEKRNCLAPGQAAVLAARVDQSLPLDPAVAYKALYPKDLIPPVHFEVTSPVVRDPHDTRDLVEVVGGADLNIAVKASDNLIGYEKALYAVEPKSTGPGFKIVPLRAELHIDRDIEQRAQPETNYFNFPSEAAFFRLIVKSDQTEFTALVIAAPTRAELERRAALLESRSASCATLNNELCIAIPWRVAINAVVPVTVNGAEVLALWGSDLGALIRQAGVRDPKAILTTLSLARAYNGKLNPLQFDPANDAILRLPVTGTEVILWTTAQAEESVARVGQKQ